jgi:hypothetical protein
MRAKYRVIFLELEFSTKMQGGYSMHYLKESWLAHRAVSGM